DLLRLLSLGEHLPRLEYLDLSLNRLSPGDLALLLHGAEFPSLRSLILRDVGLTVDGVRNLASAPVLLLLRELDLAWNALGDAGARLLAQSPNLRALRVLRLSGSTLSPPGREALTRRFGRVVQFVD